jgi:hypothetical protein
MSSHHNASGGGFIILLLFIGLIWLLVVTWPWWLLAPPFIGLIVLLTFVVKDRILRQQIIAGFKREEVGPEAAQARRILMYGLFITGGVSALVCLLATGADDVQWWLVPLILISPALRLCSLSSKSSKWPRMQRAISENLFELLVIASVVLLAYTIVLWRFHTIVLDDQTLEKLTEWDKKIQEAHEGFEHYKPGLFTSLVLLGSVLLFRFVAEVWPVLKNATGRMTSYLMAGVKWSERTGTAIAIAASLTFLATGPDGPLRVIGVALKDAKANYEHFQTAVTSQVDLSMRQALVSKAWENRPANVRASLDRAAQFCVERKKFEDMQNDAKASFDIEPSEAEDFPLSAEFPQRETAVVDTPSEPSTDWTPKQLRQAAEESAAPMKNNETAAEGEKNEAVDEAAEKVLDELSPADKLFDSSPVSAVLKEHYPVFGEFLDAISSSVTEAAFRSVRESIVRKVTERRRTQPDAPLAAIVSSQVTTDVAAVPVSLASLDTSWSSINDSRVASFGSELRAAESRLEARAAAKEQPRIRDEVRSARESADLTEKVGRETGSAAMTQGAEEARARIDELAELAKRWPALQQPGRDLSDQLNQIESRASAAHDRILLLGASALEWSSPHVGISSLRGYCDRQLERTVSSAAGSEAQTARLKATMGARYGFYYQQVMEARAQIAEVARAKKLAEERKAVEETRRRDLEERRVEEYRRPEAEHPVEIP